MTADVFGILGTKQAGAFHVERVVAEGGFAVVYRAIHEGFRAPVALKCLKVPDAMTKEQRQQFLDRFREEGEMLFRLSALVPAVVRPLHVDVIMLPEGRIVPFLALEWLDGEGLDRIVDRRRAQGKPPIDIHRLIAFLQPAAHAFAQAHRLPGPSGPIAIIHRDIKPENIFVARGQGGDTVKILDFGIARTKSAASLSAGHVTQGGALDAFTPGYAAPEQWMPKRYGQVGPWTDVFGLALTMVEVLTGKPPIEGDIAAMMGTTNDPARRPTPRNEGAVVSDEVEAIFTRALAVDPRERTQSIEAFWTALEAAVGSSPSIHETSAIVSLSMPSELPPSLPGGAASPPEARISPVARTVDAPRTGPGLTTTPRTAPGSTSTSTPRFAAVHPTGPRLSPVPADAPRTTPHSVPIVPRSPDVRPPQDDAGFDLMAPGPAGAPVPFELAASPRPRAHEEGTLAAAEPAPPSRDLTHLREQMSVPLKLLLIGLTVSAGDWLYTSRTGDLLAVGNVRPVWIAGPLVLIGLGLACWRLIANL